MKKERLLANGVTGITVTWDSVWMEKMEFLSPEERKEEKKNALALIAEALLQEDHEDSIFIEDKISGDWTEADNE